MTIQSFTLPITPAKELCKKIALKLLDQDRTHWHRVEAEETCPDCGRPMKMISDPRIGVEWVCNC